jgi:hypothetical protein
MGMAMLLRRRPLPTECRAALLTSLSFKELEGWEAIETIHLGTAGVFRPTDSIIHRKKKLGGQLRLGRSAMIQHIGALTHIWGEEIPIGKSLQRTD